MELYDFIYNGKSGLKDLASSAVFFIDTVVYHIRQNHDYDMDKPFKVYELDDCVSWTDYSTINQLAYKLLGKNDKITKSLMSDSSIFDFDYDNESKEYNAKAQDYFSSLIEFMLYIQKKYLGKS